MADIPRFFEVEYNYANVKVPSRAGKDKRVMLQAWGTIYPNGAVTLDTGQYWDMFSEMEHYLAENGTYSVRYQEDTHVKTA